jgi:hypothetical protein
MKIFHCDHCDHLIFFENSQCTQCGHVLAYLPDIAQMGSLDPDPGQPGLWRSPSRAPGAHTYRQCANYAEQGVCNWAVVASDEHALCVSCRLTHVIPNQSIPGQRQAWRRLEIAKRRLVYTLLGLKLPLENRQDDPTAGLAFDFLADARAPGQPHVLTGHAYGTITINIAEADDAERDRRREQLREPYRTLLGHFRHESGHYYWDRLIKDHQRLSACRALFGDEREDYMQSIQRHYRTGPPPDWSAHFVSGYAAAHPWEDWAETWAHYLHMTDALETAAAAGLSIRPHRANEPVLREVVVSPGSPVASFDEIIDRWFSLTYVLNNLNRGLGLPDAYGFFLPGRAIEKIRFVHETIAEAAQAAV